MILSTKKGSYFQKHKAKLATEATGFFTKQFEATPAQQEAFAAGYVLLIDKPLHWTSFDVVRKIRNSIRIKKVGHAGTLDPLATGLLIVCTGKFTKRINEFMAATKVYTGNITLGATTPTYDLESEPEDHKPFNHLSIVDIQHAAQQLTGDILQMPPVYSALKIDGTSAYSLARRGETVDLKARAIRIDKFEILSCIHGVVEFEVVCGTGTYIRSLAHDLGALLGCGAYLSGLRRTKIGEYSVEDATSLETFLEQLPVKSTP